ncbi:hypothetical protein HAX54_031430 [Datura stramonium]|uniref:Uncharacterized protein n=1 Tax=Datura stramonium TaxID=4076 RepID=A0ABS8VAI8_DATST|nr:hypothetical protein [Datura stramonium]
MKERRKHRWMEEIRTTLCRKYGGCTTGSGFLVVAGGILVGNKEDKKDENVEKGEGIRWSFGGFSPEQVVALIEGHRRFDFNGFVEKKGESRGKSGGNGLSFPGRVQGWEMGRIGSRGGGGSLRREEAVGGMAVGGSSGCH